MRVLLVDADLSNVTRMKAWMTGERMSVEVVETGTEALDHLRHYPFDLVLTNALPPLSAGWRLGTGGRPPPSARSGQNLNPAKLALGAKTNLIHSECCSKPTTSGNYSTDTCRPSR